MNWTRTKPTEEGLYLYKEEINPAIDQKNLAYVYTGIVLMEVSYYKDLQMGIKKHLVAKPQLPYRSPATPVFDLDDLDGEWREYPPTISSSSPPWAGYTW